MLREGTQEIMSATGAMCSEETGAEGPKQEGVFHRTAEIIQRGMVFKARGLPKFQSNPQLLARNFTKEIPVLKVT